MGIRILDITQYIQSMIVVKILTLFTLLFSLSGSNPLPGNNDKATTWDPWAPCETDADCPENLMCNIYQNRCTECMDDEDCPICVSDDCHFPGYGVCVYGDHC